MNEWLNGRSKENTVTINYIHYTFVHICTHRVWHSIFEISIFNKSHPRHSDEHEHTHTHSHNQKKRHSMILSYFNNWRKKNQRPREREAHAHTKKKHALFRAAIYYYYYYYCVFYFVFAFFSLWLKNEMRNLTFLITCFHQFNRFSMGCFSCMHSHTHAHFSPSSCTCGESASARKTIG